MCSEEENRTESNRFYLQTHTLHQVQSLLGEQALLPVCGKAHRLPELPLRKNKKRSSKGATEDELKQQLFIGGVVTVKQLTAGD